MAEALPSQYEPQTNEGPLYRSWEEQGFFRADAGSGRTPYVIPIPPPNVTARLHMGHGLNSAVQDLLIRWRRMQGYEALWIPGSDHAGIATQNVVERLLAQHGCSRDDLGREAFVKRVWEFVDKTGGEIYDQLRAIGCSADWERKRFTLDAGLSTAVREVFVRLYEKGLVYRGHRIINWCPRCLTALSDEEAEPEETQGHLWHLRYPLPADAAAPDGLPRLPDGRAYLVVATTRPETMLGDTAVAVHPTDERYRALVGTEVDLPLTGRRIPVVADEYVDPEFGSGAVKITPAHDPNDFEVAQRTGVPAMDVMTPDAVMNDAVPEPFRGMDRSEARRAVVAEFEELGLLEKTEKHTHAVPHCYRCDTVVEPRLSDQWFVKMKPLAEPALQAWRDGQVRFTPERFGRTYEHWLENIRDWCISRQLWWGHRIPVWYCQSAQCGETIVAREDPDACPKCGGALRQDEDVLDTWFSSWLWPFSTLGWPRETPDLAAFYPNSTLVSGQDIIFFWIARMIMAGLEFMGRVPFRDVYLTGMVRDHLGRKMSKSLGNGIDPLDVVQRYGADALRYTVLTGAGPGMDQGLNYQDLEEAFGPGRNFANKMWNAGRFALMTLGDSERVSLDSVRGALELPDRWILSRLQKAAREVTASLERFRFQDACLRAYEFFWGELADWYLEAAKPRLYGEMGDASRDAARATLAHVLDHALRLLHPAMPFITETVWLRLPRAQGDAPSIMVSAWPEPAAEWEDDAAEAAFADLQEVIGAVRTVRSEYGVAPSVRVPLRAVPANDATRAVLDAARRTLRDLARVEELAFGGADGEVGASAVLRSGTELFVPLAGVIDLGRERERLRGEATRIEGMMTGTEKKLANESFVARAPANVVQHERDKLASYREQLDKLRGKLTALEGVA